MRSLLIRVFYLVIGIAFQTVCSDADDTDQCTITTLIENGYVTEVEHNRINQINDTIENLSEVQYGCVSGYTLVGNNRNICFNGEWANPEPKCEVLCSPQSITSPTFNANCQTRDNRTYVSCMDPVSPGTVARINCQQGYENQRAEQQVTTCGNDGRWHPLPLQCTQSCGKEGPEGTPFIVAGLVTNLTRVPWNVGIYHRLQGERGFQQICGGTIVNARVVISAMHCFWDQGEEKPFEISTFRVVAGKFFREFESEENLKTQTFSIERLYRIHDYEDIKGFFSKDIVVLVLNTYLEFTTHVMPACLDYSTAPNNAVNEDSFGRVAGWGLESPNGLPSPVLKFIELPIINKQRCLMKSNPNFVPFITDDKFCAGYLNGSSVCNGDSGAGLVFGRIVNGKRRFYLKGIVSTGSSKKGSCDNNKYTTFTNIANFIEFIKSYEIPYRPENIGALNITKNGPFTEVQSSSCTISEIPINGFVALSGAIDDYLKFGQTVGNQNLVKYSCKNNYTLIGKSKNICFRGEWIAEIPTCAAGSSTLFHVQEPCQIVRELTNGWIDFDYPPHQRLFLGDVVNSGFRIKYHCNRNFELIERDHNICKGGLWEFDLPRCVSCSINVLDNILLRKYSCHRNDKEIPCMYNVLPKTILKIHCNDTEVIHETTCSSDGQWSSKPTSCQSECVKNSTPWKALILDDHHSHRCLGVILTPRIVLSNAYCFWNTTTNERADIPAYRIMVADKHKSNESNIVGVDNYEIRLLFQDSSYKLSGGIRDTSTPALALLNRPIYFNGNITPICLYPGNEHESVLRFGISGAAPELTTSVSYSDSHVPLEILLEIEIYQHWVLQLLDLIETKYSNY